MFSLITLRSWRWLNKLVIDGLLGNGTAVRKKGVENQIKLADLAVNRTGQAETPG